MSDWQPISDDRFQSEKSGKKILVQKRLRLFGILAALVVFTALAIWVALGYEFDPSDTSRSGTRRGRQGQAIESLFGENTIYLIWLFCAALIASCFYFVALIIKPTQLVLDKMGFTVIGPFKQKFYDWRAVSSFMTTQGRQKRILFLASDGDQQKKKVLPVGFGLKPEAQAALFNEHLDNYISENTGPDGEPLAETETSAAVTTAAPVNDGGWRPVDDRQSNNGFAVREERAPIFKYAVGALALLIVGGGAIWLASKVVIADEVPKIERADNAKDKPDEKAPPPKSADDLAWVKALEIDTVEGYRDYIANFPNGRHVEDAQRLINEFDEEAWKLADERDTIEGYEDYLESWPEGLHATEARERIAKKKAEEEARRKQAEEAARREAAAWKTAAETNTIPSYETYLASFPTGKNASEAQTRIERLRAEAARQQASAADEAAWNAARVTGTADAYQQYLTSFPQGAHVPEAIAKLEELRPGPGKTFKDCAVCPTMVSLPAGTAELGAPNSDSKAKPNEKPARPVTFTNLFAIGVTEVTFEQYGACVGAGGCKSLPGDNGWGQGSRPVINVSWSDAVAYAQWLSNTTGKNYGLPSGAQWEYAARGGKTDALIGGSPAALCAFANGAAKESQLPWANEACTDLAGDRTLPAGSLSKNGFGVADMIGNVAEWVLDCNTLNLRDAPVDGSADARGSCSQRIVRGGSWFSGPDDLRYSVRAVQRRGDTNDFTGFRVVRN